MRRPSIQVGDQPVNWPDCMAPTPSTMRRGTARISAIVMSAVSSVSTPGVLVTVMPRETQACTSILSTPTPNCAIRRRRSPARASMRPSIRSVMVGTSTSQRVAASASCSIVIGVSVALSSTSKSSLIRVSTGSGSRRVTMTFSFGRDVGMLRARSSGCLARGLPRLAPEPHGKRRCIKARVAGANHASSRHTMANAGFTEFCAAWLSALSRPRGSDDVPSSLQHEGSRAVSQNRLPPRHFPLRCPDFRRRVRLRPGHGAGHSSRRAASRPLRAEGMEARVSDFSGKPVPRYASLRL